MYNQMKNKLNEYKCKFNRLKGEKQASVVHYFIRKEKHVHVKQCFVKC